MLIDCSGIIPCISKLTFLDYRVNRTHQPVRVYTICTDMWLCNVSLDILDSEHLGLHNLPRLMTYTYTTDIEPAEIQTVHSYNLQ